MKRAVPASFSGQPARGSMMVELAVALVVLGVLASLSFGTFGKADSDRQAQAAANAVRVARQAILDFSLVHGRLPCPDLDGDGAEGDAGGACPTGATFGRLPTHTLGLGELAIPSTMALRYGVSRSTADADLAVAAPGAARSPAHRLLARARSAAGIALTANEPYTPSLDALGQALDCGAPGANPAFVIAADDPAQAGTSTCFPVPPRDRGALTGMGRLELVGWLQSKL
jgi:hypothetical protein